MNAPARIAAVTTDTEGCRISQTASGNVAAATIEPMEMWRVQTTDPTNTTSTAASGSGVRQRNAPTKLATALPPLKFQEHRVGVARHHGQRGGAHPQRAVVRKPSRRSRPPGIPWRYRAAAWRRRRRARWCAGRWWRRYCRCRRRARRRRSSISPEGIRTEWRPAGRRSAEPAAGSCFENGNSASLVYTEPVGRNWLRYKKKLRASKPPKSSEGSAAMASRSGCRSSRSLMRASVRCGEKARFSRGDAQRRRGAVGIGGQCGQPGRLDAAPEDARRMRIGKEADLADVNRNRRPRGQCRQRRLQFRRAAPRAIRR